MVAKLFKEFLPKNKAMMLTANSILGRLARRTRLVLERAVI